MRLGPQGHTQEVGPLRVAVITWHRHRLINHRFIDHHGLFAKKKKKIITGFLLFLSALPPDGYPEDAATPLIGSPRSVTHR